MPFALISQPASTAGIGLNNADRWTAFQLLQALYRENLISIETSETSDLVFHFVRAGHRVLLSGCTIASLKRLIPSPEMKIFQQKITHRSQIEVPEPVSASEILTFLSLDKPQAADWPHLQDALKNSIQNLALCLEHRTRLDERHLSAMKQQDITSFWTWLSKRSGIEDLYLFLEQWGARGHGYHPWSKTKLELTKEDVLAYSPEFQGQTEIRFVALKDHLTQYADRDESGISPRNWLKLNAEPLYFQWEAAVKQQGADPDAYCPLPLHPWQFANDLPHRFKDEITAGDLLLLDTPRTTLGTTLSFRTLSPLTDTQRFQIKLPVHIKLTSAIRTVSPASINNGPRFNRLLRQILIQHEDIASQLRIMEELFGAHFKVPEPFLKTERWNNGRFLSVIYREHPKAQLRQNESAVVVAALRAPVPGGKHSLFRDIAQCAGCHNHNQLLDYLRRYMRCVLIGHFDLYLRYGIALEGHQQNTLAIFDSDNQPVAMLARDFAGMKIHLPSLLHAGYDIDYYPGSSTISMDRNEIRKHFIYTCLQSHLGDLILILSQDTGLDETVFWEILTEELISRFQTLKNDVDPKIWYDDWKAILEAPWSLKALLSMQMANEAYDNSYAQLPNPLTPHVL